jgi:hypothetical protein
MTFGDWVILGGIGSCFVIIWIALIRAGATGGG